MRQQSAPSLPSERATVADVHAADARRRRRLRRITLFVTACIVGVVGLRLWWGWHAHRRLEVEIARIREAGEPLSPEDFNPTTDLADEDNAAYFYEKAMAVLTTPADAEIKLEALADWRAVDQRPQAARRIIEANAVALRLMREARSRTEVDWGVRFSSPIMNVLLPKLAPQREMAKFARAAAYAQHVDGDDAAAVETLHGVLALAEHSRGTPRTVIITHLVSIAIDSVATQMIEQIAPTLRVQSDGDDPTGHAASREQVEALIQALLDERGARAGLRRAWIAERASAADSCATWLPLGAIGFPSATVLGIARPLFESDLVRVIKSRDQMRQASEAATYREAESAAPPEESDVSPARLMGRPLSSWWPVPRRVVTLQFRALAERRRAAVALAVRLYEVDHGHPPESLDELVPDYLAEIPLDPTGENGQRINYSAPSPSSQAVIDYSQGQGQQRNADGGEQEAERP